MPWPMRWREVCISAYLHWSLVDNYEWEPTSHAGLFGLDRRPGTVRWMETDAQGDDAAGAFGHAVRGLLSGDRSVLNGAP